MNQKLHFKMYKAGKLWLVAGIFGFALGVAAAAPGGNVHADSTNAATAVASQTQQTSTATNQTDSTATAAQSTGTSNQTAGTDHTATTTDDQMPAAAAATAVKSAATTKSATSVQAAPAVKTAAVATAQTSQKATRSVADGPTTTSQIVDQANQSDAETLTHGDQNNRLVNINVSATAGDKVSVTIPYIFTASYDTTGNGAYSVAVTTSSVTPDYTTTKTGQSTNLTFTFNKTIVTQLHLTLTPTVSDWSLLPAGNTYAVAATNNGDSIGQITYTIDQPATITSADLSLDQNQQGNLVTNQQYVFGLNLNNNGASDSGQFTGTATIDVPAGFVLSTTSGSNGIKSSPNVGDEPANSIDTTNVYRDGFNSIPDSHAGQVTFTQPGGAGTPIIITFTQNKAAGSDGSWAMAATHFVFVGSYTQPIAADDNKFNTTVTYHSTDAAGEAPTGADETANGTTTLAKAVDATANASVETSLVPDPAETGKANTIYTDNGTADGAHQADDASMDFTADGHASRAVEIVNNGNVAQTNMKVDISLEPGTVLVKQNGAYGVVVETAGINQVDTNGITATLTNGTTVTLNGGQIDAAAIAAGVAKDGSNITKLSLSIIKLAAGTKAEINFMNNSLLSKATTKVAGDTADYSYTVTSDQGTNVNSGTIALQIATPSSAQSQFTGIIYAPNSAESQYVLGSTQTANISYALQHIKYIPGQATSYLLAFPVGFDANLNDVHLYQNGQLYTNGSIEDMGYIGINGEHVFKVTLADTPAYEVPVYVKGTSANTDIVLTVNPNVTPGTYQYPYNGMSLLMEINDQGKLIDPTTGDGFPNISSVTLAGVTYPVRSADLGFVNGSEAHYTFVSSPGYAPENQIALDSTNYAGESSVTLNYTDSQGVSLTDTTGKLRLETKMNDNGTADYSYNAFTLPSVTDGGVTVSLKNPTANTVTNLGNAQGELLYSTVPLTGAGVTAANYDSFNFVSAADVTDWTNIRTVLLKNGPMTNGDESIAELKFTVTQMKPTDANATAPIHEIFTGSINGSATSPLAQDVTVNAQRFVTVATKYVDQDGQPLAGVDQPAAQVVESGTAYTTEGLAADKIPAGLELEETPTNAQGVTGADDVTVDYVYKPTVVTTDVTVNYVDVTTGQTLKTVTLTGNSGDPVTLEAGNMPTQDANGTATNYGVIRQTGATTFPSSGTGTVTVTVGPYEVGPGIQVSTQTETGTPLSAVTVNVEYVDAATGETLKTVAKVGNPGQPVTLSDADVPDGYGVISTTGDLTYPDGKNGAVKVMVGKYEVGPGIEVGSGAETGDPLSAVTVNVDYVDAATGKTLKTVAKVGNPGQPVTLSSADVPDGYGVISTTGDLTYPDGKNGEIKVLVGKYEVGPGIEVGSGAETGDPLSAVTVNVYYVDAATGNTLKTVAKVGNPGQPVTLADADVPDGYGVIRTTGDLTYPDAKNGEIKVLVGKYEVGPGIEVGSGAETGDPLSAVTVAVNYVDQATGKVIRTVEKVGNPGQPVQLNSADVPAGYTVVSTTGDLFFPADRNGSITVTLQAAATKPESGTSTTTKPTTPSKPTQPTGPAVTEKVPSLKTTPVAAVAKATASGKALPKTGDETNEAAQVAGILALTMTALGSLVGYKKKRVE